MHLYSLRKRPENLEVLQRTTVPCLTRWSESQAAAPHGVTCRSVMPPGIRYTAASASGTMTGALIISSGCSALKPDYRAFPGCHNCPGPPAQCRYQKKGVSKRNRAQPGRSQLQNPCSRRRLWLSCLSDA